MILSQLSVKRPIGITMIMCIVTIFGIVSLYHLPIDLMPDITYPRITISASYGNASPVEIETLVTRPIEQAIAAVPGVEEITSDSSEGSSRVRVAFAWDTNLDAVSNDIRDRLDRIIGRLPDDMDRPRLRKFDAAAFPIVIFGAAGDLDPVQMLEIIENQVKYRIERIPGVASLDVRGGNQREIHVDLNMTKLKALGISPDQIISRLRAENINLPAGTIESGNYELRLRTPGEFSNIEEIKEVVVGEKDDKLIRLENVAKVVDSWEDDKSIIRIDGKPAVRVMVNKQSGSNTVAVANAVKKEIEEINREIPQLRLTPIIDTSIYIERAIDNVSAAAFYGGLLAIIILQFFLANITSTLIIAIAIPFSIIATFALMYYFDFTLNIMSLGGVALGIGMLVDNSIVVLENIFRYREKNLDKKAAAVRGSSEVAMPVLASTLTTVVIFLPLLFIEGMTGIMFKQLAFIVAFALFCSLAVSLTMVPMLSSQLLALNSSKKQSIFKRVSEKILSLIFSAHSYLLNLVLNNKAKTTFIIAFLLTMSIFLIKSVGTEFMPAADEGEVRVRIELEEGTKIGISRRIFLEAERIIAQAVPERTILFVNVGGGWGSHGTSSGRIRIPLVPMNERERSTTEVAADLREKLKVLPGVKVRVREGQGLFILRMGRGDGERLQLQIRGHDLATSSRLGAQVKEVLETIEGVTDVEVSRTEGIPERIIAIDRARAADLNLSINRIAGFMETVLSGSTAGYLREQGDEYRILVQAENAEYSTLEEILNMQISNSKGQPVMLKNVARIVESAGPIEIERMDQERTIDVRANIEGRALGFIVKEVQEKLKTIPMPSNFSIIMAGDYEEQQESFKELGLSFILALVLVYMVMAVQYESLYDPVIVMITVPLSIIGVIPALYLTGTTLNVQSFIGCIMLGGIVVNNSILLVDHINLLRETSGLDLHNAVKQASRDRCRPILMTASTTILGLLPLAIGLGEGGEMQAPMARAVIGGLICSTFISLTIIPMVYIEFEKIFGKHTKEKIATGETK
jgi:HAE1 family hydrophobic/amphiphilic exporter-1